MTGVGRQQTFVLIIKQNNTMKTLLLSTWLAFGTIAAIAQTQWINRSIPYQPTPAATTPISAGYLPENPARPFRGNVLYLPGFADSYQNHTPYLRTLAQEGYRIISFDYPGMGSSTTPVGAYRITTPDTPYQLSEVARVVWAHLANQQAGADTNRVAISWCIGSLIALQLTHQHWLDANVFYAPSYKSRPSTLFLRDRERWLSSAEPSETQHIRPIYPESPLKVLAFAKNIKQSASILRRQPLRKEQTGIAFVTGERDRFIVGGAYLKQVLAQQAPGFEQVDLPQARHEIHNETATIRDAVGKRTLLFLNTYFSATTTLVASRGAN